jgi:uncharacterized protein YggL (DUF469 family)
VNKRIKKKKHLGKFREYGIQCDLNFAPNCGMDKAFDDFIDFVVGQGWEAGGGGNTKQMSHFVSHNPWAGVRRVAQKSLTQADADKLSQWLREQPWCGEITKLEVQDAWYGCGGD